jgi:hypothetical protein
VRSSEKETMTYEMPLHLLNLDLDCVDGLAEELSLLHCLQGHAGGRRCRTDALAVGSGSLGFSAPVNLICLPFFVKSFYWAHS